MTLDRKLEIINYTGKNSGKKQNLIAGHFNIKPSTLCGILKEKKARSLVSHKDARGDTYSRKRIRQTNF